MTDNDKIVRLKTLEERAEEWLNNMTPEQRLEWEIACGFVDDPNADPNEPVAYVPVQEGIPMPEGEVCPFKRPK